MVTALGGTLVCTLAGAAQQTTASNKSAPGAQASHPSPLATLQQYCVNCHASAADEHTVASLVNVEGYPGEPLVFLSQHFFEPEPVASHHRLVALPTDDAPRLGQPHFGYSRSFVDTIPAHGLPRPRWESVAPLPSQT